MTFEYKKLWSYEDNILTFLMGMEPDDKIELSSLTDQPDKLINAVKRLIDEGWLRNGEFFFSNDYRFIQRDGYRKWFSSCRK